METQCVRRCFPFSKTQAVPKSTVLKLLDLSCNTDGLSILAVGGRLQRACSRRWTKSLNQDATRAWWCRPTSRAEQRCEGWEIGKPRQTRMRVQLTLLTPR